MIKGIAIQTKPWPLALKLTNIRSYVLITGFVLLSALTPWVFHQLHLAGATYLPMHLFILVAGLAFGWRAGLITGLLSPLTSYAISGMPLPNILPQLTIELATYGLLAGVLHEKFNLRITWSLLGAMLGGRLVLLLTILFIYFVSGATYSPLGVETTPILSVWHTVKQSLPGILLQLAIIPVIFWIIGRYTLRKRID
ncbi:ECF transporter S component [Chloroflexota bacterium]